MLVILNDCCDLFLVNMIYFYVRLDLISLKLVLSILREQLELWVIFSYIGDLSPTNEEKDLCKNSEL